MARDMRWASSSSEAPDLEVALGSTASAVQAALGAEAADVVLVFVCGHGPAAVEGVPRALCRTFGTGALVGCTAGGVIGGGHEIEGRPSVAILGGVLPAGAEVAPFHLGDASAVPPASPDEDPSFVLLADPATFDAEAAVRGLDERFPGRPIVGGLASGMRLRGGNALWVGDLARGVDVHRRGAVGLALSGARELEPIVAQGCRPVGDAMFVTRCTRNIVHELNGKPAVQVIRDVFGGLPERDQELFRQALFLGIAMNQQGREHGPGDFLVRNVIGLHREIQGAMVVGAELEPLTVVQFHVRDAKSSEDDLAALLDRSALTEGAAGAAGGATTSAALLFSCLGRGAGLYGAPDHDSEAFRRRFGPVPVGGFFCSGEIGPVRGRTFVHGYTSSFGLIRERRR
jgi:small ligand-binding sensory domain FIST